jgi:hypothetical protein
LGYEKSDCTIGYSSSSCTWNRFLDEYGTVLLEYGANFTYVISKQRTNGILLLWTISNIKTVNYKGIKRETSNNKTILKK